MKRSVNENQPFIDLIRPRWGWLLAFGILLTILGIFAITFSTLTTMVSIMMLGFIILIGGLIMTIDTFQTWWGRWGGFFLHLFMSILYLLVGMLFITTPLGAAIPLTLLLAVLFIIIGTFRMTASWSYHSPQWGLYLFSGIITLLLGILILAGWPASSIFIIGLFVGIDLLFIGINYMVLGLTLKSAKI